MTDTPNDRPLADHAAGDREDGDSAAAVSPDTGFADPEEAVHPDADSEHPPAHDAERVVETGEDEEATRPPGHADDDRL